MQLILMGAAHYFQFFVPQRRWPYQENQIAGHQMSVTQRVMQRPVYRSGNDKLIGY